MIRELTISFHVQNPLWKSRLRPYTKTVQAVLENALAEARLKKIQGNFEVAVVLADDAFVQNLNNQYRGKNKPTNVLSFPADSIVSTTNNQQSTTEFGDIILALETIEKEAIIQGKTFRNHASHLLIHGFLHLLGYDHIEEKDAVLMEKMEIKILKKLSISNPYL